MKFLESWVSWPFNTSQHRIWICWSLESWVKRRKTSRGLFINLNDLSMFLITCYHICWSWFIYFYFQVGQQQCSPTIISRIHLVSRHYSTMTSFSIPFSFWKFSTSLFIFDDDGTWIGLCLHELGSGHGWTCDSEQTNYLADYF